MSTKVQLIGGSFQDSEGAVLANGYLKMRLSQDCMVNNSQVCSGVEITIQLDSNGNVASTSSTPAASNQFVWGNDQLAPINSFYRVTGYKANGQPAWGPNNQQVIGNGGTFDVGTWVPNSVVNWTPSPQIPFVKVNGVALSSQAILDFENSGSVTWVDAGNGQVQAAAAGGSGMTLVAESHQTRASSGTVTVTPTLGGNFSKGLYQYFISFVLASSGTEVATLEYCLSFQSYGGIVCNQSGHLSPPPGDVALTNLIGGSSFQLNEWVGVEFGGQGGFALEAQPSLKWEFFTDAVNPLSVNMDLWIYRVATLP